MIQKVSCITCGSIVVMIFFRVYFIILHSGCCVTVCSLAPFFFFLYPLSVLSEIIEVRIDLSFTHYSEQICEFVLSFHLVENDYPFSY